MNRGFHKSPNLTKICTIINILREVSIKDNSLSAYGLISRKLITAKIIPNDTKGIRFIHPCGEIIEASADNVFSTQRNTVLAKNGNCVCLTEHFLAGAALAKINNVDVYLDAEELPFGDGGAKFWFDFLQANFKSIQLERIDFDYSFTLFDEQDKSRFIKIEPASEFQISYKLITSSYALGTQEYVWSENQSCDEVSKARTFSSYAENQMLELQDWVLGFDDTGFKQELYFDNEPARHKLLDLIGDLYLSKINPLALRAKITSNKAGHELNTKMAKKIMDILNV
jgi:UDP-3-O-[3-hydroxymyristoyl] N-acetylglucosamine deacetylase